jgi:hypothetical protein
VERQTPVESFKQVMLVILPHGQTALHINFKNYDLIKLMNIDNAILQVPFIRNLDLKTPLHLCLEGSADELRVAEYFLNKLLPGMPIDHHGKAIAEIIPECIKSGIWLNHYLDSRIFKTNQLNRIVRICGKD